jgi:hypothetical protein
MTTAGWITMTVSLVSVWSVTFWCFRRVLTRGRKRGGRGEPTGPS